MRALEYRSPRVQTGFGVDFLAGTEFFRGSCIDVSTTGIRASFDGNVPMNRVGSLILHHPKCQARIPARVIYLKQNQVGFAFFNHSEHDHEVLSRFMAELGL